MKQIFQILSVLLIAILMSSCGNSELKKYADTKEMVADAKEKVSVITAEELKNSIENEDVFSLVDCREKVSYDSASIIGSINIPRGVLEFQIGNKVTDRRENLYVFCSNGEKSALVVAMLPSMKYAKVKVIEGGFDAFKLKYPDLVELEPAGDTDEPAAPAASSGGGCGG